MKGVRLGYSKLMELTIRWLDIFTISPTNTISKILLNDLANTKSLDERIFKLSKIQADLKDAIDAVDILKDQAETKKKESEQLNMTIARLKQEIETAQSLLKLPEDAITSILIKANSKGRARGIIEGLIIGLITGCVSSYLIWHFTKGI